jgi:hypothetical protein
MTRREVPFELSPEQRSELQRLIQAQRPPKKAGPRCWHRIACGSRQSQQGDICCIGHQSCDCGTMALGHTGLAGLQEAPRPGRNNTYRPNKIRRYLAKWSSILRQATGSVELPNHGSAPRFVPFGGEANCGYQRP